VIAPAVISATAGFPTALEIPGSHPLVGLSFFTGAMGLDLGLELGAGVKFLLAADSFAAARATIRANRPAIQVLHDASRLTAAQVRKAAGLSQTDVIDVVAGCPPCPPWSVAGKRLGVADPRGMLLPGFIDLAMALAPRVIVHENVPGLASAELGGEKGGLLRLLVAELRRNGYRVTWAICSAADYGAPQNRERLVLIASRDVDPLLPEPTHSRDGSGGLPRWRTLRDALQGLPEQPCDCINYSPTMLRFMERLHAGQWWKHLPPDLRAVAVPDSYHKGGGGTGTLRRLSWDRACPTVTCSPAQKLTTLGHPDHNRPLSVQECMRVQGFPDDWRIRGSIADRYMQTGNAVPIPLAEGIGTAVARTLGITTDAPTTVPSVVEITSPPPAHLSRDVSKKGRRVLAFLIRLPKDCCPFSTDICRRLCFAKHGRVRWYFARYDANYEFTKSDRFVDAMVAEIRREAELADGEWIAVCIHGKGEFYNLRYLSSWRTIMQRTADIPNLHYFVYTRSWVSPMFRAALDEMANALPNVRLNLSVDPDNARQYGIPARIGDGLVTWLAETDAALPPAGATVDIIFRNTAQRKLPPAEFLEGFRVCPNEAHLFFSPKTTTKLVRITCSECRLCIDRSCAEWDRLKATYRRNDDHCGSAPATQSAVDSPVPKNSASGWRRAKQPRGAWLSHAQNGPWRV